MISSCSKHMLSGSYSRCSFGWPMIATPDKHNVISRHTTNPEGLTVLVSPNSRYATNLVNICNVTLYVFHLWKLFFSFQISTILPLQGLSGERKQKKCQVIRDSQAVECQAQLGQCQGAAEGWTLLQHLPAVDSHSPSSLLVVPTRPSSARIVLVKTKKSWRKQQGID